MKSVHPESVYRKQLDSFNDRTELNLYLHDIVQNDDLRGVSSKLFRWNSSSTTKSWEEKRKAKHHQLFLICIDDYGNSVTVQLKDYVITLAIILPEEIKKNDDVTARKLVRYIEDRTDVKVKKYYLNRSKPYYGFKHDPNDKTKPLLENVLYIDINKSDDVKAIKNLFNEPVFIADFPGKRLYFEVEEDIITNIMGFSLKTDISPCEWFRVSKWVSPKRIFTHSQAEIKCSYLDLIPMKEKMDMPKFIIASIDIETDNPRGFAKDGQERVICISTHTMILGDNSSDRYFTHYMKCPDNISDEERREYMDLIKKKKCIPEEKLTRKGEVKYFTSELEMLEDWSLFIRNIIDPDIITGHNIYGFDYSYLFLRAAFLSGMCKKNYVNNQILNTDIIIRDKSRIYREKDYKLPPFVPKSSFFYLSKFISLPTSLSLTQFDTNAQGTNDIIRMDCPGRVQIDLLVVVKKMKFVEKKLKDVSKKILKLSKEDVNAQYLYAIWRANLDETIITYCETDSKLPTLNLAALKYINQCVERGRITITKLDDIINKGVTAWLTNAVIYTAKKHGCVLNAGSKDYIERLTKRAKRVKYSGSDDMEYWSDDEMGPTIDENGEKIKFSGAYVIPPKPGIYDYVAVLDFNSLYPTIIIVNNLCPSTIINLKDKYKNYEFKNEVIIDDPVTGKVLRKYYYCDAKVWRGIIPILLDNLIRERGRVRELMKQENVNAKNENRPVNDALLAQLDVQQLALKITANGLYGGLSAEGFTLKSRRISESTTAIGRKLINMAIKFVEENYKEFNPLVVYGDTDSIFPQLHVRGNSIYESIYKLSIIAKGISKNIAGIFPEGLVLDFEKLYSPMIIKKKKKYAGIKYEPNPSFKEPDVLPTTEEGWKELCSQAFKKQFEAKGISIVQNGAAPVVKEINGTILKMLFDNQPIDNISRYYEEALNKMINGHYNVEDFIYYVKLSRSYSGNPPSHAVVNEKKHTRQPGSGYNPGDFVPLVYLVPESSYNNYPHNNLYLCKKYKAYNAECPEYIAENSQNIVIDYMKYIEKIHKECSSLLGLKEGYMTKMDQIKNNIERKFLQNNIDNELLFFSPLLRNDNVNTSYIESYISSELTKSFPKHERYSFNIKKTKDKGNITVKVCNRSEYLKILKEELDHIENLLPKYTYRIGLIKEVISNLKKRVKRDEYLDRESTVPEIIKMIQEGTNKDHIISHLKSRMDKLSNGMSKNERDQLFLKTIKDDIRKNKRFINKDECSILESIVSNIDNTIKKNNSPLLKWFNMNNKKRSGDDIIMTESNKKQKLG